MSLLDRLGHRFSLQKGPPHFMSTDFLKYFQIQSTVLTSALKLMFSSLGYCLSHKQLGPLQQTYKCALLVKTTSFK